MIDKPNIVQAEFFHVGSDPDASIAEVMNEAFGRFAEGFRDIMAGMDPDQVNSGIKTCVRFYDDHGELTELARRAHELEHLHLEALGQYVAASGIRQWLLKRRFRRLLGEISGIDRKQHALAIKLLEMSVRAKKPIGVERADLSFRPMRDDEAHELIESVRASHNSWLFIFEHNDLLADKNKSVEFA